MLAFRQGDCQPQLERDSWCVTGAYMVSENCNGILRIDISQQHYHRPEIDNVHSPSELWAAFGGIWANQPYLSQRRSQPTFSTNRSYSMFLYVNDAVSILLSIQQRSTMKCLGLLEVLSESAKSGKVHTFPSARFARWAAESITFLMLTRPFRHIHLNMQGERLPSMLSTCSQYHYVGNVVCALWNPSRGNTTWYLPPRIRQQLRALWETWHPCWHYFCCA